MSPRFVARTKADRGRLKVVPETDRVTLSVRTVTLACGCRTRKQPVATKAGGVNLHFCPVHPGLQKERR